MISFIENLPGGNAIRLVVTPEAGTTRWRVLRKTTSSFSGYDDPAAVLITDSKIIDRTTMYDHLDIDNLTNGTSYYYAIYEYDGTDWTAVNAKSIVSQDPITDVSADPFDTVIERIDQGLQAYLTRAGMTPGLFTIAVRTIPPNLDRDPLPIVTVRVLQNEVIDWALACDVIPDEYLDPDWKENKGWFGKLVVEIRSFSPTSQVRNTLRKALQTVIQSNLSVFPAWGWYGVSFDQRDSEDYKSNNTPVFVSIAELSFTYVTYFSRRVDEIADVEIEFDTEQSHLSYSIYPFGAL